MDASPTAIIIRRFFLQMLQEFPAVSSDPFVCRADGWISPMVSFPTMKPLKARVRNGRLVLDEPTDLPEGEVVELVLLTEVLASGDDDLDDEERAALQRDIEASFDEEEAGQLIDAADAIADLRSRR